MSERGQRTWWPGKGWWIVGVISTVTTVALMIYFRLSSDPSPTLRVRAGEVETAEFTVPIPNGHSALSRSEVVERSSKHPPAKHLVLMLMKPGTGGISILRQKVRSKDGVAPLAPTMEECVRYLGKVTAERGDAVVVGATLVEYSAAGLGRACMFSVAASPMHMTQISTSEWGIVCGHPAGEGAACEQVAAGFRRR